jgi:hypothetical protein
MRFFCGGDYRGGNASNRVLYEKGMKIGKVELKRKSFLLIVAIEEKLRLRFPVRFLCLRWKVSSVRFQLLFPKADGMRDT